ncbi:Sel1-like repeat [Arabidopsis thaliana x Arabidopsis arenosa]|uniref:Sel1-like repeat n=1 Tax=Arabidopsis thaliana x Arabidopsis arenosa TaxID=1240361 RepID=A0A8T2BM54_9BRAS|nr:Sel1-like repeat [Arabidopsis thaliana x Arabidopsis arenosa]
MRVSGHSIIFISLFILSVYIHRVQARPFVLVLSNDDFNGGFGDNGADESSDFDEFGESEPKSEEELDPGSWRPIFEPNDSAVHASASPQYYSGLNKILSAASVGNNTLMEEAVSEIDSSASSGDPHAQSVMGFVYGIGMMRETSRSKSILHHHFAAEGGNMQSKMALAFRYLRQNMHYKAVELYAELAETAVNSFLISKDSPMVEPIRIHIGTEENKDALRKSRGEEDEDFQILEYQAEKGNSAAMHKIGLFYYFGLRGLRRDHAKALYWFSKAVEKGEPMSMELLGEIYARGAGVERNYDKARECLTLAVKQGLYSAFNGLGYLYVKGYGVDKRNYTKAREYFEMAANNEDPSGHYNLGVLYLKGIGVKKDVRRATKYFFVAANAGQPKAFYQLAKMFHTGVGLTKNLEMATTFYKLVAERGPWSSLSRWALEAYLKGDVGKAFILYSRMSELGYEVAQSNAAWILDKFGERSMCMGVSGFCTDKERHDRAHSLWWRASEQGNEHAALLIGDAYYYGRGTERDFMRAAEAYMYAKSQSNAQAMFNLGYMHEHGEGLPFDLHLAKRYYDQALQSDAAAKLPVTLALASVWVRRNYADTALVQVLDSLPEVYRKVEEWVENVVLEEGNATILTLFLCLMTVLYLRGRQRRQVVLDPVGADVAQPLAGPVAFPQ